MKPVLANLLAQLGLERIEQNIFRGQSQDLGWGAIFGGQVVGQALSAAVQTVGPDRHVHSLHGYFLRQGDAKRPVVYEVDPIRDGKSFTTRRVVAVQGGHAIFSLEASFQLEEPGLDHQEESPNTVPPDDLQSDQQRWAEVAANLPSPLKEMATADRPIEIRQVDPTSLLKPEVRPPHKRVWLRASDALPDDPLVHRILLAYASDFSFLTTALQPHGVSWLSPKLQIASLDHAMWFHRPFRIDDWLLYVIDSPSASGARGLVLGRFYDRQGRLVASAAQEGLIRRREGVKRPP